jgi:putative heme-binding domain-containing protein
MGNADADIDERGEAFLRDYIGKRVWAKEGGDGIEDDTQLYFESKDVAVIMGMALTPPGYARGEGVFIASRNQVLLLLDKNGDNRADEVVTVASGWPPPKATAGGVSDSLGVAVAADGTVYFGLGTNDFTNAYVLDPRTGKSGYDLAGERGTVQRVSPDFSRRETVATGIRFTVGLALNRAGDLFATEQEGATWLPNGNPFDELLHIRTGLHYGFPPMHPRHLPSVIDEPSVFDYGPQHQSAVGLAFNEPVSENGPVFGPAWWRGDALVAAMSRGKIYRTQLVKTAAGYVAANSTIAQLQRIIIDQAVSPTGALAVTLHSGKPDWGTGPTGAGELWKLVPSATLPPQPVVTWSASPRELRVAFDREIGAAAFAAMRGKVRVMQGRYAQAGDRFETMRPGYQVVRNQLAAPHYDIPVSDLRLDDGGRTLVITTAERSAAVVYTISVEADAFGVGGGRPYGGQIDLQADLTGVEAEWQPAQGTPVKAWLPHPDFAVARALTAESAATRSFFSRIAETGSLLLRGQMDLGLMLYPAVQSGSKLDWSYPTEKVTVTFSATRAFRSLLGDQQLASKADGGRQIAAHTVVAGQGAWFAWNVAFASGAGDPGLTVTWTTDRSATPRPLPLRRMLLPYARAQELPPMPHNADLPQLAGGNWLRGREVFQSICATCHSFNGQGPRVGPDLANLVYRDYDSVLRDIREPSAAINPEHVGYQITKTDGSELTAVVLAETADAVTLAQVGGPAVDLPRREITAMKPLAASLMPPGLDAALEPEKLRDLMRFLLVPGLTEPAPIVLPNPPPPRPTAELEPALRAHPAPAAADKLKPLRIVLCAADKDAAHLRAGMHDYPLWRERWSALLGVAPGVVVETADRWPSTEQWQRADIVVSFHSNPAWSAERAPDIDAFLARGGGLVFLHYSINAAKDRLALAQRLGHAWGEKGNKYRIGATPIVFNAHDITKGFPLNQPVGFNDETYADMLGDLTGWSVLATSAEPSGQAPQVWLREHGKGRFFVCIPGHHTWTHDDPLYRLLVFRGMLWSAREPLGRFNELTTLGARLPQ